MAATAKLALWLLSARTEQRVRETMHEWAPLFATIPEIEAWAERVLFANSLEQVFAP